MLVQKPNAANICVIFSTHLLICVWTAVNSQMILNNLNNSLKAVNFSDMLNSTDCNKEVFDLDLERCESDSQCGSKNKDLLAKYAAFRKSTPATKSVIEKFLGSYCTYVSMNNEEVFLQRSILDPSTAS